MDKQTRILLAEDHSVMRAALRSLLDSHAEFSVIAEASNGREVLALAETLAPDVVVMDVNMPELNGVEATRQLRARFPRVKVLGLSIHMKGRVVAAMLEAGARGYVPKNSAASELLEAIRTVMKGKMYVSPNVMDGLVESGMGAAAGGAFKTLTEREREVLQLLAEGHSCKEIADKLGLSVPTIHTHRQHVMQKTGARGIADLVRYAIREGISSPEV